MPVTIDPTLQLPSPLRIVFTDVPLEGNAAVHLEVPCLGGPTTEELFPAVTPIGVDHDVRLFRSGTWLFGHAHEPFIASELAARTESLYHRILAATHGCHLYRIWNYVPQINAHTAGLEHYRSFCQGRSLAFEATLGPSFRARLPAASAVGRQGSRIDVIFAAGETVPTHFENPEQVPAYNYPIEHGPRAPSFARATVARDGHRTWTFISGTSAIKGHETVAPGVLDSQLDCTLDNLRLISRKAGLGDDLAAGRSVTRHFKIYLRHASDFDAARARLERSLFLPQDVVTYLNADVCRAALNIEIEATLVE